MEYHPPISSLRGSRAHALLKGHHLYGRARYSITLPRSAGTILRSPPAAAVATFLYTSYLYPESSRKNSVFRVLMQASTYPNCGSEAVAECMSLPISGIKPDRVNTPWDLRTQQYIQLAQNTLLRGVHKR